MILHDSGDCFGSNAIHRALAANEQICELALEVLVRETGNAGIASVEDLAMSFALLGSL